MTDVSRKFRVSRHGMPVDLNATVLQVLFPKGLIGTYNLRPFAALRRTRLLTWMNLVPESADRSKMSDYQK
jgi:hypothetical protein